MDDTNREQGHRNRTLSPALVCSIFDINKSTLLRWEREGLLPPAERDLTSSQNERTYTRDHVRAITQITQSRLKRQLRDIEKLREDLARQGVSQTEQEKVYRRYLEVLEIYSLHKFLAGDLTGLMELREYDRLMPKTIQSMVRVALELYEPSEQDFADIMDIVALHARKLTGAIRKTG